MLIAFFFFAFLTVLSAAALLWVRQVLYAAFALLFTFLGVAGLYVLAGADFVAVVQLLVYVGGVLLLLVFGIMLTTRPAAQGAPVSGRVNRLAGTLAAAGLFAVFAVFFLKVNWAVVPEARVPAASSLKPVGMALLTDYLLPFEVSAVLLLAALVGAAYIAGRKSAG